MKCKKCGTELYEKMTRCMRCGYSEVAAKRIEAREIESYTIGKNPFINKVYINIFGHTDKKIVGKFIKFIIIIIFILWIFYSLFIYVDLSNRCFITIRPSFTELSNTTMKKGIKYLKNNFPNEYTNLCKNVVSIDPNISCGGFGGGCYSLYSINPGVIDISTPHGDYIHAAKVMIHETCHAMQFKEGRPFDETECYKTDEVIPW